MKKFVLTLNIFVCLASIVALITLIVKAFGGFPEITIAIINLVTAVYSGLNIFAILDKTSL